MVEWHHWLNGHEFEQTGRQWWTGKPGVLQFMGSQRVRHGLVTEWQDAISSPPWDPSVCDEAGRKRLSQKKRPDEPRDRKSSCWWTVMGKAWLRTAFQQRGENSNMGRDGERGRRPVSPRIARAAWEERWGNVDTARGRGPAMEAHTAPGMDLGWARLMREHLWEPGCGGRALQGLAKPSRTAGGNVNWCGHCEKQYGASLQN